MAPDQQKIKCPKCGESISIDTVLTHQNQEPCAKSAGYEDFRTDVIVRPVTSYLGFY